MPKRATPPEPAALGAGLGRVITATSGSEELEAHAGLLIWAILRPEKRSANHVARALGIPRGSPIRWAVRWCWRERVARAGADADRQAAMLYRQLYVDDEHLGRAPLDRVSNLIGPETWLLLGVGPPVLQVEAGVVADETAIEGDGGEGSASNAERANPGIEAIRAKARAQAEQAQEAHRQALLAKEERERKAKEEHERTVGFYRKAQALLESYVGKLLRDMQAAMGPGGSLEKIEVKPRDLPKILEQHRELSELLGVVQPVLGQGPQLEPSYRVTLAQATGGDVLQAMVDDAAELMAILTGLRARRDASLDLATSDPSAVAGEPQEAPGGQEGHSGDGDADRPGGGSDPESEVG